MATEIQAERAERSFSGYGGLQLHAESWQRDDARATVIICHGYAEHCRRYDHVCRFLYDKGFNVSTYDWRNHGRSPGMKGYVASMDSLVEDLSLYVDDVIRKGSPDLPVFLLGHSTGGGTVALYAIRKALPERIRGLILSAPTVVIPVNPVLKTISGVISRVLPKMKTVDAAPRSALSRDPEIEAMAEADPLFYKDKVMARTGYEILRGCGLIQDGMARITLPTMILYGTADTIVDPAGGRLLYEGIGSRDKTIESYEGFYHEILNETGKEKVMTDMLTWLERQLEEVGAG